MPALRQVRRLPLPVWQKIVADYLQRTRAPLDEVHWAAIDAAVARTANGQRIARRFLPLRSPVVPGMQPLPSFSPPRKWATAGAALALPIILQDRTVPDPGSLRLLAANAIEACTEAAAFCAQVEDSLIFNGHGQLGYPGLLNTPGRLRRRCVPWDVADGHTIAADLISAIQDLTQAGFSGPHALAAGLGVCQIMKERLGDAEAETLPQLFSAGLYTSAVLRPAAAVVLAAHPECMELAVAQDLVAAYLGQEDGAHQFRLFEIAALHIAEPQSICTLESAE